MLTKFCRHMASQGHNKLNGIQYQIGSKLMLNLIWIAPMSMLMQSLKIKQGQYN